MSTILLLQSLGAQVALGLEPAVIAEDDENAGPA
jgi:hypothetical protein